MYNLIHPSAVNRASDRSRWGWTSYHIGQYQSGLMEERIDEKRIL
jgi:hypothetical protein